MNIISLRKVKIRKRKREIWKGKRVKREKKGHFFINNFQLYLIWFSHRRKGLAFIDLNAPHTVTKKVSRNSKWECGAVEWNPHLTHAHIFAYTVSVLFFV